VPVEDVQLDGGHTIQGAKEVSHGEEVTTGIEENSSVDEGWAISDENGSEGDLQTVVRESLTNQLTEGFESSDGSKDGGCVEGGDTSGRDLKGVALVDSRSQNFIGAGHTDGEASDGSALRKGGSGVSVLGSPSCGSDGSSVSCGGSSKKTRGGDSSSVEVGDGECGRQKNCGITGREMAGLRPDRDERESGSACE